MNTHRSLPVPRGVRIATLAVAAVFSAPAAVFGQAVWLGAEAEDSAWFNANNWESGLTPTLATGGSAVINSGSVTYTPGGDLSIGQGGSLTMNGGSWIQDGGIAWMNIGQTSGTGTLTINSGASFNTGTSQNLRVGNGGTGIVNISGGSFTTAHSVTIATGSSFNTSGSTASASITGTVTVNGTLTAGGGTLSYGTLAVGSGAAVNVSGATVNHGGALVAATGRTYTISGGSLTIAGELKPVGGNVLISGGTVTANLISFDGVPADTAPLELSGGTLQILGSAFGGMWNSANSYVNFTEGSTAQLIFTSVSATTVSDRLGTWIRYNDGTDITDFIVADYGPSGSIVTIAGAAIPEPSTAAVLAGLVTLGFVISRRRRA